MALRLAFDLDGTLADMDSALRREAARLFGGGAPKLAELTDAQARRLWRHVGEIEDFWATLGEVEPGAVGQLAALASLHGWEVIFLTQRPATAGETAQVQSQRWLQAHGFELPSVFVMTRSRGKVADAFALDAVVDDRPENCLDVVTDSNARALLVWRDSPDTLPPAAKRLGIEPVYSIADALERLQQMTARAEKPDGLVGRLRAAIGI